MSQDVLYIITLRLQTLFKRLSLQLQLQNEGIQVREPGDVQSNHGVKLESAGVHCMLKAVCNQLLSISKDKDSTQPCQLCGSTKQIIKMFLFLTGIACILACALCVPPGITKKSLALSWHYHPSTHTKSSVSEHTAKIPPGCLFSRLSSHSFLSLSVYNQGFCYGYSPLLNSLLYVHVSLALAAPQLYFQYSLNLLAAFLIQPRRMGECLHHSHGLSSTASFQFCFSLQVCWGCRTLSVSEKLPVLLALSPFPGLRSPPHCREYHWLFSSILASHHDFPKITEWLCKVSNSLSTWKCIPSGPFTHS